MITKISLKNIATFDEQGIQIDHLKKINFIYGSNGSGKTVISNFLTDFKNNDDPNCSANLEPETSLNALVYNKKFRDDNFRKSTIAGVFTLGNATAEEKKVIEYKQRELAKIKEYGEKKKETLQTQQKTQKEKEEEFKEIVWKSAYKKHEGYFKEAFKGHAFKKTFKSELLSQFCKNTSSLLSFDELKEKSKTIFGETPSTLSHLNFTSFDDILKIENQGVWNKKIIGKADVDIAQLIQRLNLNDWVNKGREYLQEEDETCPFCQEQTITTEFRKQLDNYFDESFTKSIEEIKNYVGQYNLSTDNLINTLTQIESAERNNKDTKLDIDIFSANLKILSSQFDVNKNLLNEKTKEPSRSIDVVSTADQLNNITQIIRDANEQITKHNDIVKNYNSEKEKLIKSVWKYISEEHKATIENFNNTIRGLTEGVQNLTTELKIKESKCSKLDNEIKNLTQNVTSVQPTIDSINKTLNNFGFYNFKIVPSKLEKNSYQIQRENGDAATDTLSEGETTFITFLYFMQLAKGSIDEKTITDDRVLVVDDPISSLDSNVLFVVSSLLKEVIKEIKTNQGSIKQIILLTHNIYFHKEVSFIDGRTKNDNDTFYWILRKKDKRSSIQCYETENPIHTSYELLWKELQERDCNSGITIHNTMRRIIENYFKILGKYGDDDLINKFENSEDQAICRSLICWVHDGSHSISDDLFIEHQENINNKYFDVFKKIFSETGHESHYYMMMGNDND